MKHKSVLVAGATGYLGQYLVQEFIKRKYNVRILIRKESQKEIFAEMHDVIDFFVGEITNPNSLSGCCVNIDWVVSTVGITRQKDGLTYMDVDYQGNSNLLNEAKLQASSLTSSSGVELFLYVSAIGGDKLRQLKIFEAKERFVDELKESGIKHTIVMRPNGFFSDMRDFLDMAKGGAVYLFGHGEYQFNPIHGTDLANVCVDTMIQNSSRSANADGVSHKELSVGGPDMFTLNEVAILALKAWGKDPPRIIHVPHWIRKFIMWTMRTFTSSTTYGPIEFFLTMMAMDSKADMFGTHHLYDFFTEEVENVENNQSEH